MTATNHALTGAAIGLIVGQPLIALPAAVASHFVLDVIPHFKRNLPPERLLKSQWFRNYLFVDGSLCVLLVISLAILRPEHWLLAALCAFAAAAPDMASLDRYLKTRHGQRWHGGLYARFAQGIQWFERPIGLAVEIAWLIAALVVITPFLR